MADFKNTTIQDTGFLQLPVGTTAQRPSNPEIGMARMNSDKGNALEFWDGEDWTVFGDSEVFEPIQATGGTVTSIVENGIIYRVHTFTSGTSSFIVSSTGSEGKVDVFAVGGGGGGSNRSNGGGGGGYARSWFAVLLEANTHSVVVGDGGTGTNNGSASSFDTKGDLSVLTADGGFGTSNANGGDGGSGGGGRRQGNCVRSGGEDGTNGVDGIVGDGGSGQGFSTREFNQQLIGSEWETIDPNSTAPLYGSGGGGYGSSSTSIGMGGVPGEGGGWGGGRIFCPGHPSSSTYVNTPGEPNTGGGGGSSRSSGGSNVSGGSGIVKVRYPLYPLERIQ